MKKMTSLEELDSVYEQFVDKNEMNVEYVQKNYSYQIPDISSYEKKCIKKVSMIYHKLRRNKVAFQYDPEMQDFQVSKYRYEMSEPTYVRYARTKSGKKGKRLGDNSEKVYSEYPTIQWIGFDLDENDYWFGGEEEDLFRSSRLSEVIDFVIEWLGNNDRGAK